MGWKDGREGWGQRATSKPLVAQRAGGISYFVSMYVVNILYLFYILYVSAMLGLSIGLYVSTIGTVIFPGENSGHIDLITYRATNALVV